MLPLSPLDKIVPVDKLASQPLSLHLNNRCYPLASCPLDKEWSDGQTYAVDILFSILNNRAQIYKRLDTLCLFIIK